MEGGSGPNGRQGRNIPHGDVNHKEWRDRSEAVGTTNVVGVWRGRSAGTMIFGRDGAPGSDRKRARQIQAAPRVAISATGWACSDTSAAGWGGTSLHQP